MSLCSSDYGEIEECVADMFEDIGYAVLPVNVFELCKRLKIQLKKYSDMKDAILTEALSLSADGLSYFDCNRNCFVICYNDSKLDVRIRFTIMHEIGHIMLGHKNHSVINEQKANAFARIALAPLGMIYKMHLKDVLDVAEAFGISLTFSQHVVNHYNNAVIWGSVREKIINSRLTMIFEQSIEFQEAV
ncbi:MAG: ImmA/IrrE family metallo-endopeptidase [Treponemataceae bacterium]|nr:ImmA/IrrE family metallo-endopeptidase [Treponemataceae bacterium]